MARARKEAKKSAPSDTTMPVLKPLPTRRPPSGALQLVVTANAALAPPVVPHRVVPAIVRRIAASYLPVAVAAPDAAEDADPVAMKELREISDNAGRALVAGPRMKPILKVMINSLFVSAVPDGGDFDPFVTDAKWVDRAVTAFVPAVQYEAWVHRKSYGSFDSLDGYYVGARIDGMRVVSLSFSSNNDGGCEVTHLFAMAPADAGPFPFEENMITEAWQLNARTDFWPGAEHLSITSKYDSQLSSSATAEQIGTIAKKENMLDDNSRLRAFPDEELGVLIGLAVTAEAPSNIDTNAEKISPNNLAAPGFVFNSCNLSVYMYC